MGGGKVITDDQGAQASGREAGVERVLLVSGLKQQGLGRDGIGEGDAGLPGDGGHGGLPGLLLLIGALLPRRERARLGLAMGFVGSPREVLDADAAHAFNDARGGVMVARKRQASAGRESAGDRGSRVKDALQAPVVFRDYDQSVREVLSRHALVVHATGVGLLAGVQLTRAERIMRISGTGSPLRCGSAQPVAAGTPEGRSPGAGPA